MPFVNVFKYELKSITCTNGFAKPNVTVQCDERKCKSRNAGVV